MWKSLPGAQLVSEAIWIAAVCIVIHALAILLGGSIGRAPITETSMNDSSSCNHY